MRKGTALARSVEEQVQWVLAWLEAHSTKATLEGMSRYAIPSEKAEVMCTGTLMRST